MELMRGVGWNVDRIAGANGGLLATKSHFDLALEQDESLFEVVAMGPGSTARRDVHVDHAEASVGVVSRNRDCICVANEANVLQLSVFVWAS